MNKVDGSKVCYDIERPRTPDNMDVANTSNNTDNLIKRFSNLIIEEPKDGAAADDISQVINSLSISHSKKVSSLFPRQSQNQQPVSQVSRHQNYTNISKKNKTTSSSSDNWRRQKDDLNEGETQFSVDSFDNGSTQFTSNLSTKSTNRERDRTNKEHQKLSKPTREQESSNDTSVTSSVPMYSPPVNNRSQLGKPTTTNNNTKESTGVSDAVFRDVMDDERLKKRTLVINNIPESLSQQRRDEISEAYLSILPGGGGSGIRWISPTICVAVFATELFCLRAMDRAARKPELAEYPPVLLSNAPSVCTTNILNAVREVYDNIPPAARDTRPANRMISAALGIRMPRKDSTIKSTETSTITSTTTAPLPVVSERTTVFDRLQHSSKMPHTSVVQDACDS